MTVVKIVKRNIRYNIKQTLQSTVTREDGLLRTLGATRKGQNTGPGPPLLYQVPTVTHVFPLKAQDNPQTSAKSE